MVKGPRRSLPPGPLLAGFRAAAGGGPNLLPDAVRTAAGRWLHAAFLDAADDAALAAELFAFSSAVHPFPLHPPAADRRVRFARHAANHLLRGQDPLPERLARCATPGEAYFVPGLGLTFWTAVVKALDPDRLPLWCPATDAGLVRLGLLSDSPTGIGPRFAAVLRGYAAVGALPAGRADDFLERVGRM